MILNRREVFAGAAALAITPPGLARLVDDYSPAIQMALPVQPPFAAVFADGRLGMVATQHTQDPNSRTFAAIRAAMETVNPRVLVSEGFPTAMGDDPSAVLDQVRGASGPQDELAYAMSLALDGDVTVVGGEPTDAEAHRRLIDEGFDPRDAFYARLFGPLDQDVRTGQVTGPQDAGFDAALERWMTQMGRRLEPAPDLSAAAFRDWYRERFGRAIEDDPDWRENTVPGRPGPLQRVTQAQMRVRDVHLLEVIAGRLEADQRVVAVYGGSHVATLWRALTTTYGTPRLLEIGG